MIEYNFHLLQLIALIVFVLMTFVLFKMKIRKALNILRFTFLCLFLILSARLIYKGYEFDAKPNIIALIDISKSMDFGEKVRSISSFLLENLSKLKQFAHLRFFTFSESCEEVSEKKLSAIKTLNKNTAIFNSLATCADEDVDHILLFSDGFNNIPAEKDKILMGLKKPVFPIVFRNWMGYRDVAIVNIEHPVMAFKNLVCEVRISCFVSGYEGKEINVILKSETEKIGEKRIYSNTPSQYETIDFQFIPKELGEKSYTVEIKPQPDEINLLNNRRKFKIFITREKTRILYLCGRPGPEYFFLRKLLKSDPYIELVTFVILRNPENLALAPDEELSLIPFPTHTLFTRDIFDFDLLIFENFTYRKFPITFAYLENIKNFVKEGGGFIMIGGENSFGKGFYGGTPLEEILPVELESPMEDFQSGLFKPAVVDFESPIVRLSENIDENKLLWEKVPHIDGYQKLVPKEKAQCLLIHPHAKSAGKNISILSVWDYGKGRVAAVGTNSTWNWAMRSVSERLPVNIHTIFWQNLILWVTKSIHVKDYEITFDKLRYTISDEIEFAIIPLTKSIIGKNAQVRITSPLKKLKTMDMIFDKGAWRGKYIGDEVGTHIFEFKAGFIKQREVRHVDVVELLYDEMSNVGLNFSTLKEIADSTGGRVVFDDEIFDVLSELKSAEAKEVKWQVDIHSSPILFVLMLLILFSEWSLRRILGYH